MFRLFVVVTFISAALYSYQAVKRVSSNKLLKLGYWLLVLLAIAYFIFGIALDISENFRKPSKMVGFANFFAFYIFLTLTSFTLFIEDIGRFLKFLFVKPKKQNRKIDSRRKFISKLALGIGSLPFATMIYGVYQGRYNFKVHKHLLKFKDLPNNFDGYKIVHISDFHCGGLDNYDKVEYAVNLIKEQKADIILFTGDFIDRESSEIEKWKPLFSSISTKDGKYSILGNHDYCDYIDWSSEKEKDEDFNKMKSLQKEMGYELLLNENVSIVRGNQKIRLIGVEYWGAKSRNNQGDINNALRGVGEDEFKILLSHDPTHWEYQIINHSYHFHLTLSGHTHGLQFGIEIPKKFKWAPFEHRFKYWAGLYKELGQYLNVNRGFGYTGFPGRVGIWPEISVITLKTEQLEK
jgi:predicted MPP superfamily phosphohydrolase